MINKRFEDFDNIPKDFKILKIGYYFSLIYFKIYLNYLICLKFNEFGNETIQKLQILVDTSSFCKKSEIFVYSESRRNFHSCIIKNFSSGDDWNYHQ